MAERVDILLYVNEGGAVGRQMENFNNNSEWQSLPQRTGRPSTSVMRQRGAPLADEVVQAVRRPARGKPLRERAVLLVARSPDLPLVCRGLPAPRASR